MRSSWHGSPSPVFRRKKSCIWQRATLFSFSSCSGRRPSMRSIAWLMVLILLAAAVATVAVVDYGRRHACRQEAEPIAGAAQICNVGASDAEALAGNLPAMLEE